MKGLIVTTGILLAFANACAKQPPTDAASAVSNARRPASAEKTVEKQAAQPATLTQPPSAGDAKGALSQAVVSNEQAWKMEEKAADARDPQQAYAEAAPQDKVNKATTLDAAAPTAGAVERLRAGAGRGAGKMPSGAANQHDAAAPSEQAPAAEVEEKSEKAKVVMPERPRSRSAEKAGDSGFANPAPQKSEAKKAAMPDAKPEPMPVRRLPNRADDLDDEVFGGDREPPRFRQVRSAPPPVRHRAYVLAQLGTIGTGSRTFHSDRTFRPLPAPVQFWPRDARYRSNYLPGRGYLTHLAQYLQHDDMRFDAVNLLQAPIPQPTLPQPTGRALDLAVDELHAALPPQGGATTLRLRLRAGNGQPQPRRPLHLHLVLDTSGSMRGASWTAVCAAVRDVATRLTGEDRLSIVTYGSSAQILSQPVTAGPQSARLADRVCKLRVHGETNIYDGLRLGYQQALQSYDPTAVNRLILLSDGMATVGPRDLYSLTNPTADALGQGITTSAIGVGKDFDALLMGRIALEGGGNDHFVRDAAAVSEVFHDELDLLSREAAEVVEVRVRLPHDIELLEVIGSEPLSQAESLRTRQVEVATDQRIARNTGIAADRQRDENGGVRFLLPAFRLGDEHTFLLQIKVPAGRGTRELAAVELRYKDMITLRNVSMSGTRTAHYAESAQAADASRVPAVAVADARGRSAAALQRASEYLDPANLSAIRGELYSASSRLQAVADWTGDAVLHADSRRLHSLADLTLRGVDGPRLGYFASVYHYNWRYSGATAWVVE